MLSEKLFAVLFVCVPLRREIEREIMSKFFNKFRRKLKIAAVNVLAFRLAARGCVGAEARKWVNNVFNSYANKDYTSKQRRWAVSKGFSPVQVEQLGITKENYKDTISAKDYACLRPLNGIYSKWITDIITVNSIFKPFRKYMPERYYQLVRRDFDPRIIPLNGRTGETVEDIIALLEEKGELLMMRTFFNSPVTLAFDGCGNYFRNHEKLTREELIDFLSAVRKDVIISEKIHSAESFRGGMLNLIVFNEQGDNPIIGEASIAFGNIKNNDEDCCEKNEDMLAALKLDEVDKSDFVQIDASNDFAYEEPLKQILFRVDKENGKLTFVPGKRGDDVSANPVMVDSFPEAIPCWQEIRDFIDKFCRFAPQIEYFGMNIRITDDGFRIMRFLDHPSYPVRIPFSKETSDYLKNKLEHKNAFYTFRNRFLTGFKTIKAKASALFARTFFPKDLLPYLSTKFMGDFFRDLFTNKDTTLKEKIWAIKHGFISYRLHQYGITEENWVNYISDFEYKWLRHINNKYRHWMEDKITVKYICSDYNECFPEYYYHISLKNGNNKVLPMMDCPEGYEGTFEDIFRLVQEKGSLALKPDEGSHGDGFYKLTYRDGKYYLNHNEAALEDVLAILTNPKNQYLVTEYINMHDELKRIYAGAVNTIRMIVFKKDVKNPVIGNAYMRFGSARTGAVDNMGAGGMFAKIDIDTGKFYDAKIIEANEIKPCLYHPDTNEKIEGYLPNWEKVKQTVLDVARNIPQLEYFGFDLALTDTGLKFPEINRFPDYPAIEKYTPETMDYLLYKLDVKKKKTNYTVNRGKQLFKLPDRPVRK